MESKYLAKKDSLKVTKSFFFLLYVHDMYVLTTVTNPCGPTNAYCSHYCLLSSTSAAGYQCDCPDGMALINETNCGREYI